MKKRHINHQDASDWRKVWGRVVHIKTLRWAWLLSVFNWTQKKIEPSALFWRQTAQRQISNSDDRQHLMVVLRVLRGAYSCDTLLSLTQNSICEFTFRFPQRSSWSDIFMWCFFICQGTHTVRFCESRILENQKTSLQNPNSN